MRKRENQGYGNEYGQGNMDGFSQPGDFGQNQNGMSNDGWNIGETVVLNQGMINEDSNVGETAALNQGMINEDSNVGETVALNQGMRNEDFNVGETMVLNENMNQTYYNRNLDNGAYFDPMTGQPIQNNQTCFDPMTGQPIQNNQTYFDPMTGAPMQSNQTYFDPMTGAPMQNNQTYFDPMTGEPVQNNQTYFDPMTGEPMQQGGQNYNNGGQNYNNGGQNYNNGNQNYNNGSQFDPMTGKPIKQKKKGGKGVKIAVIAAAVVVVGAGAVFGAVKGGIFMSKSKKVLMAAANTLLDTSHTVEALKGIQILSSDEFTVEASVDSSQFGAEASFRSGKSKKQLSGNVEVPGYPGIDFLAELTNEQLMINVPVVSDDVFTYNYMQDKTGYIADMVSKDQLDMLDNALSALYSGDKQEEMIKDMQKAFYDAYNELEFEKADAEEFEVDGKDRKCKGYTTQVTSKDIEDFLGDVEDIYKAYDLDVYFNEAYNAVRQMPDVDVTFYIYKNKLSCIRMEVNRENMDLLFLGGDTRMQNMQLVLGREKLIEINGKTKGSEEQTVVYVEDERMVVLSYDYKSGDFDFQVPDEELRVRGNLISDKKALTLKIDSIEDYYDNYDFSGTLSIKKGASMDKLQGETFDIGEASEMELQDVLMGLQDFLY